MSPAHRPPGLPDAACEHAQRLMDALDAALTPVVHGEVYATSGPEIHPAPRVVRYSVDGYSGRYNAWGLRSDSISPSTSPGPSYTRPPRARTAETLLPIPWLWRVVSVARFVDERDDVTFALAEILADVASGRIDDLWVPEPLRDPRVVEIVLHETNHPVHWLDHALEVLATLDPAVAQAARVLTGVDLMRPRALSQLAGHRGTPGRHGLGDVLALAAALVRRLPGLDPAPLSELFVSYDRHVGWPVVDAGHAIDQIAALVTSHAGSLDPARLTRANALLPSWQGEPLALAETIDGLER